MDSIKEPQLTLPPAEAAFLRKAYERAQEILEYGSGGSTVMAARMAAKRITSVESSEEWIAMMKGYLAQSPGQSPVAFHHADIGPTREWGYPKDESKWRLFIDYPFSVWDRHLALNPDLVLIDGRFRMGCFVATLMNIRRPCTILFDDYGDREYYHVVERLLPRSEMIGRMARFEARPGPHTALTFPELVRIVTDPR